MNQTSMTSPRAELAIEWFLLNPGGSLADCAAALGLPSRWLAQVVASDSFQGRYAARCTQLGQEGVLLTRCKMQALHTLAVDRGMDLLESGKASERFIADMVRAPLDGAAPSRFGSPDQHLHIHVSATDLEEARRLAEQVQVSVPRKLGATDSVAAVAEADAPSEVANAP